MRSIKKFLDFIGLNTNVGKEIYFDRSKYRPSGHTAPSPNITYNYPLKEEGIADQSLALIKRKADINAANVRVVYATPFPRSDFRNLYNRKYVRKTRLPDSSKLVWQQVSEVEEANY